MSHNIYKKFKIKIVHPPIYLTKLRFERKTPWCLLQIKVMPELEKFQFTGTKKNSRCFKRCAFLDRKTGRTQLIDFFHFGYFFRCTGNFFEWWKVFWLFCVIIDTQSKFDHSVDSSCKLSGFIKGESRC